MARKLRVAIVGPGSLGTALGTALRDAGYAIDAVIGRRGSSFAKARSLAGRVGARAITNSSGLQAKLIWFCVPDGEIARAGRAIAEDASVKGKVIFHSSGALTSSELQPFRRRGAAVASVHPLMTFVSGSHPRLAGVPFAIEGDAAAVRLARRVVRDLEGQAYAIRKKDKAAYHAWGMFTSPLFTALLATTERVAASAGVDQKDAIRRMMPILQQTLKNYAAFGAPGAFSGPIIRGDVETIRRHLRVLKRTPVPREVYIALARAAVQYLPAKNKAALNELLDAEYGKSGTRRGGSSSM